MRNTLLILLLLFAPFAFCLDYTFSLNYPFLLRNDYMGITSVARDISNELLMFLQNNEVRRYSSDLTSYTRFNTPDLVFKSSSDTFVLPNVPLSNGTSFNIQGKVTTTISRTFTTVKTYSYPNFTLLSDYQGAQTVIDYKTIALQSPSADTPINIIIGSLTVKVYYTNQILTVFDYGQIFTAGVACKAAKMYNQTVGYGTDFIGLTVKFYAALDNNKIIDLTIVLSLEFNFSSQLYGLFLSASYAQIISLSSPAANLFFENGVLLMQEGNGQISAYDAARGGSVTVDATIPTATLQDVIFKDGRWYFLHNNQLIQAIYQAGAGFSLLNSISSYAGKQYHLVVGLKFDLIYVSGESYIYKMGYCLGQSYFDGVGCSNYSCFDTMCTNCWMHSSPCGVCNPGYPRTDNYQCLGSPPNNTANSTINSTNSINATLPINTTALNSTNSSSLSLITTFLSGKTQDFMISLSNILKFSISLPSGRRIVNPLFYFFGNFDDIYLYSFHDAFYGRVAEGLFEDISDIQNAKWSIIERQEFLSFIFGQDTQIRKKISYRTEYLSYRYHFENKVRESQGLFYNSYDYFLFSLPVSIIFFLVLRAAYKCSQGYTISQVFRIFSLWGFLFILNFDGNIQQFTFYLFAEIKNLSFSSLFQKMMAICFLLFGFIVTALSFGGYLVGLLMYRKLNRNLTDNNRNSIEGNMELLFQNCMRNFILGAVHSLLRYSDSRNVILSILLVIEIAFQGLFVFQATRKVFKIIHKFWFYSLISFTRIILIITFLFQHRSHQGQLLQQIQIAVIVANIAIYVLSIAFLVYQQLCEICKFLLSLFLINKSIQFSSNLHEKTIKSRIFTLSKIAQQNHERRKPNIFQINPNAGKSVLTNQSKTTQF